MPVLSNARNVAIVNSEFTDIGVQLNSFAADLTGIHALLEASIPDAAVDAEARRYDPSCFPGTREQYIKDITNWAVFTPHRPTLPMYWMKGAAGVGKSAIAQSCAANVKKMGQLGAAFFFSINGRNDHTRFFTTLAYQLSTVLPGYRDALNKKVCSDKTLVRKTISSQFQSLIVEPLQMARQQGVDVDMGKKTIFVDGLDECRSTGAQSEIIEIIAASVRDHTTPFRWALFSRPEPHIQAAFASAEIAPLCQCVLLPISRQIDDEIGLYLEGSFRNILQRRNFVSLVSVWPTKEDTQKLVDASAGLYAYAAVALRFIDNYPSANLDLPLRAVLASRTSHPARTIGDGDSASPFSELDALYMLIMQHIPQHLLSSVNLLLTDMLRDKADGEWPVVWLCNRLGLSQMEFGAIYNQLHAVLEFQQRTEILQLEEYPNILLPYYRQEFPIESSQWLRRAAFRIGGTLSFCHKSFYDFLADADRSSHFCATVREMREKLFDHCVQSHMRYAESYTMEGPNLVLAPGVTTSASMLSWPLSTELLNSYMKEAVFTSFTRTAIGHRRPGDMEDISASRLRILCDLDYPKHLASQINVFPSLHNDSILGCPGDHRIIHNTLFCQLQGDIFLEVFDIENFTQLVKGLEKLGIIKRYHANFASRWKFLTGGKRRGSERSGIYTRGHGNKSVYWYWKFDAKLQYYHQFETTELSEAISICGENYASLWGKS